MTSEADVVVIGAGHNGLVCACYLARAGLRVAVLEAADSPGAASTPSSCRPGGAGWSWAPTSNAGILGSGVLSKLAANDWHLDKTATALGTDRPGLISRLDRAGFANLLRQDVLDAWRARQRRSHT